MSNPFAGLGIDLPAIVATTLGTMASVPAVLTKITPGSYDINNPAGGIQSTSADYACKAVVTKFEPVTVQDELQRTVKAEIVVYLGTVTGGKIPAPSDHITLVGPDGVSRNFAVEEADIDAAGAAATCKASG